MISFPKNIKTYIAAAIILPLFFSVQAKAIILPENVAVVINADDSESKAVANSFITLRKIPAGNIIYLNLDNYAEPKVIGIDQFRETILSPVLAELEKRKLAGQIDCIAYSSGIPAEIDFSADLALEKNAAIAKNKTVTKVASINGLTYMYQLVLAKDARYALLGVNFFACRPVINMYQEPKLTDDQVKLLQKAHKLRQEAKYQAAREILIEMLRSVPISSHIRLELAALSAQSGQTEKTVAILKPLIDAGWCDVEKFFAKAPLAKLSSRSDITEILQELQQKKSAGGALRNTTGFKNSYQWMPKGLAKADENGVRYMLSIVLGLDGPRGLSVEQSREVFSRSVNADFIKPDGSIFFMTNSDIRTKVRQWAFDMAVYYLKQMDINAAVITGKLPTNAKKVAGLMTGSPALDIANSSMKIQPGAICEHFTSHGGVLQSWANQTPMRDFLIAGAAISGGAVTEPFAIAQKFPSAFMHCHYAKGLTAIEAVYQSITGPYQYLIAGDPLCKPYAKKFELQTNGLKTKYIDKSLPLQFTVSADNKKLKGFIACIDGRYIKATNNQGSFSLDISSIADGYHELKIIAMADDDIESKATITHEFIAGDIDLQNYQAAVPPGVKFSTFAPVAISYNMKDAATVQFLHNSRVIALKDSASGVIDLDTKLIGSGKTSIQPKAIMPDGRTICAKPILLNIKY